METGALRHSSGRIDTEKEIHHAKTKNPKPNFVIRVEKQYAIMDISNHGEKIVRFFAGEVRSLRGLVRLLVLSWNFVYSVKGLKAKGMLDQLPCNTPYVV